MSAHRGVQGYGRHSPPPLKIQFLLYWGPFCYFFSIMGPLCYVYLINGTLFYYVEAFLIAPFFCIVGDFFWFAPPPHYENFCRRPCPTPHYNNPPLSPRQPHTQHSPPSPPRIRPCFLDHDMHVYIRTPNCKVIHV